jgi:hypothetical protein
MAEIVRSDMSTLRNIINEIKELDNQQKNIRERLKQLKEDKKELENKLIMYIDDNDIPGIRYHNVLITPKEVKVSKRLKKQEKEANMLQILEENGVSDPKKVLSEFTLANKSYSEMKNSLDIQVDDE